MPQAKLPAAGLGEPTALLPSWRLHLEASNLSPRTIRAYTDGGALLAAFLTARGMPTAVLSIRRERVETLSCQNLSAPLASAATRYRSLQRRAARVWRGPSCPGSQAGRPLARCLAAGALSAGLHEAHANLETAPWPRVVLEEGVDLQAGARRQR